MKQAVEKKIRELIPELKEWTFSGERAKDKEDSFMGLKGEREDIHLEHVLRAIEKSDLGIDLVGNNNLYLGQSDIYQPVYYNLSKDFNNQSEELYSFLAKLLEVTQ